MPSSPSQRMPLNGSDPFHDSSYGRADQYADPYRDDLSSRFQTPQSSSSSPASRFHPAAHPDSAYNQMRSDRVYSSPSQGSSGSGPSQYSAFTPAQRDVPNANVYGDPYSSRRPGNTPSPPSESDMMYNHEARSMSSRGNLHQQASYASGLPLASAAYAPGISSHPAANYSDVSLGTSQGLPPPNRLAGDDHNPYVYTNAPYNRYSSNGQLGDLDHIDPNSIADDGDDGFAPTSKRRSFILPLSKSSQNSSRADITTGAAVGTAAAVGAGAGAAAAAGGGAGGNYASVPGSLAARDGGAGGNASDPALGAGEKSEWLVGQNSSNKKLRLIVGTIVIMVIVAAIVGGTIAGVITRKSKGGSGSAAAAGTSAADDTKNNGILNKDSDEIKQLLNNANLKKVFPGVDYTPINTQYPDCVKNPPSQNNVTRDLAVLSQLTNTIRLYGTDCNQTEMVLEAINQLDIKKSMKVWLGVWLDNNNDTNNRQISQMWDIIDNHGGDQFSGVVVGNEVLYRKDLTATALATILSNVKTNLTSKGLGNLPLATSDLGDNWTTNLASEVDVVMANIHPFFAGVTSAEAASWTYEFWQGHDVAVTKGLTGKTHVISEVGWPSAGGNNCGGSTCTSSTQGSIAGISEMNEFMESWVCAGLKNGTSYFWFEAFDEPWKIQYNEPDKGKEWEDKWGLMDVNRNLKQGVKIPDCNGQRVS